MSRNKYIQPVNIVIYLFSSEKRKKLQSFREISYTLEDRENNFTSLVAYFLLT